MTSFTHKPGLAVIEISCDGVWAGSGNLTMDGEIVNCSAVLGDNQRESDATYEAIQNVIADGEDSYGEYTWTISEAN